MVCEVTRFQAATEPPTIHATQRDAVTAEIAMLMGCRSDEVGTPLVARLIVDRAPAVIACLSQLHPAQVQGE
ncbi:MAG: hypothetical protein LCH74_03725 [Proteobacteria bacterium]|nr:hypothetical protein [Pseudomonadota bacterium]